MTLINLVVSLMGDHYSRVMSALEIWFILPPAETGEVLMADAQSSSCGFSSKF